jgi:peptidoglycan biosynthesis protein MviN/MurJ (putative lipid II flippase)
MVYADRLRRLVERKDQVDYAHALQTVLKGWLFVHIPATYGLILLAMLHVLLVYSFGGAR